MTESYLKVKPCSRIPRDFMYLQMAVLISQRATCRRRSVGCVLVDRRGHVLGTGYNGVAAGVEHCIDSPCAGASLSSGTGLDKCEAIHAEANALLQCTNVHDIDTAYCTDSPCVHCVKLLMNTSCRRILFIREYPHVEAKALWVRSYVEGRERQWHCALQQALGVHIHPRDRQGRLFSQDWIA